MTDMFARGPVRVRAATQGTQDKDSVDLRIIARRFWKDRMVFLITMLACGLLAFVLVSRVTPQYTSMSQVLLDSREQRTVISSQVVTDRSLNDQVMGSELSIIRSNTLLESVIAQIDAEAPGALDLIDSGNAPPSSLDRFMSYAKSFVVTPTEETPTELEMARLSRIDRLIWAIRRSMDVWRDGDSYVISISAQTPSPELSMQLARAVAEQYVLQQLEGQRSAATQAANWIEMRIGQLREEVKLAENAVEDYRASSIEDTGTSLEIITQRLVSLNDQLIETRSDLVAAESRYNEIERVITQDGFEAIGSLLTSSSILTLNTQRLNILAADAQWAQNFDSTHPERRKLQDQLTEVNRALQAETQMALDSQRNEVQIARIREQTMSDSLEDAEQQFLEISRSSNGLRQLEREADVVRNMYIELLNRHTETRTREQLQQADSRIIERATLPGAPSAPRPKLMTMMGLLIGAVLGAAIVTFRQISRGVYSSVAELEGDTGLPVFSALAERKWPHIKAALRDVSQNRMGTTAESIRRLRNEMSIGKRDSEPQSIALVSALQDEGKTTTTILLANLTEKSDKLVVVVDCDFRQNAIQREFKFNLNHDFADLLAGDCTLLDALHTDTGLGFDVLVAREPKPDLADTLTTETLRATLDELKKYYDTVLVNCPAILPASEALMIAGAVDQRVMLVRYDSTQRSANRRALNILANNHLDVSGQVLTRVDPKTMQDNAVYHYAT